MIARIYPVKRMPRRFGFFDYEIPDELSLQRGDLVEMPFRGRLILGIVESVKNMPLRGRELKTVSRLALPLALSEREVSVVEWMARDSLQSPSSILWSLFPFASRHTKMARRKRASLPLTIPKQEADQMRTLLRQLENRRKAFVIAPDLRRSTALLKTYLHQHPKTTAVLVLPTVHDVELVAPYLSDLSVSVITGDDTLKNRFHEWQTFRNGSSRLLLGTRITLPLAHERIDLICVFRSGDPNHKQADRNPRFDARILAEHLHDVFQTKLWFFDVSPRTDDLHIFGSVNVLSCASPTPVSWLDLQHDVPEKKIPVLSHTAFRTIESALLAEQKILCIYNKKEKIDEKNVQEKNFGNQKVFTLLKKTFPHILMQLVDQQHLAWDNHAQLSLVTDLFLERMFDPFERQAFDLVLHLSADAALYQPSFRAVEHAVRSLEQWRSVAHANTCTFIVQTRFEPLFRSFFDDPIAFLKNDLVDRKRYGYPPSRRWMRVSLKESDPHKQQLEMTVLRHRLIEQTPDLMIQEPFMDKQKKYILDLFIDTENVSTIMELLSSLPDQYIIDTNVFV